MDVVVIHEPSLQLLHQDMECVSKRCPTQSPLATHSKWERWPWDHKRGELSLYSCCSTGESRQYIHLDSTVELALDIRIAEEVHNELSAGAPIFSPYGRQESWS